jgi:hypothetical protein
MEDLEAEVQAPTPLQIVDQEAADRLQVLLLPLALAAPASSS